MRRRIVLPLAALAAVALGGVVAYGQLASGASSVPSPVATTDESATEGLATPPSQVAGESVVHILAIDGPDVAGVYRCVADAVVKIRDMRIVEVQEASARAVGIGEAVASAEGAITDTPEGAFPGMPVH